MEVLEKMVLFSLCWRLKGFLIQVCSFQHLTTAPGVGFLYQISLLFFIFLNEGPGVMASKTCMDKVATSLALNHV